MFDSRPCVLSIAGFDPSAGAGVLADVKTFEQCNVYGMAVASALTVQNDTEFKKVEWVTLPLIIEQVQALQEKFEFGCIKIGLIENLETIQKLILYLKSKIPSVKLIWDPVLSASSGFEFHNRIDEKLLEEICSQLYLITPNFPEMLKLGSSNFAKENARQLSRFCCVYLKGGHNEEKKGEDILFTTDDKEVLFRPETNDVSSKHGSGCVLSSAITAGLASGLDLEEACNRAKKYITGYLASNSSLLGFHSGSIQVEHE